jgi:hypothetical protein
VRHTSLQSPVRALLTRALVCISATLILGTVSHAEPINLDYSTSMVISDIGLNGTPVVGYSGINAATVTTQATTTFGTVLNPPPSGVGSVLPLGEITITPPSVAQGTSWSATYNDTPFYLTVSVNSENGDTHAANPPAFVVEGYLTGALSGNGPSSLTATFVRPESLSSSFPPGTIGSFSSGGYDTFLSIPSSTATISGPNGVPGGLSLAGGLVAEQAAPEPASFVVLALLGLARAGAVRLRSRRRERTRVA